jgi:hypothetical protein
MAGFFIPAESAVLFQRQLPRLKQVGCAVRTRIAA